MTEPVQYKFVITSQTLDCTEAPKPEEADKCRIAVYDTPTNVSFSLVRDGKNFNVSPEDADRVRKNYPSYQPPAQKLKDLLEITRDFYNQFGDRNGPTSIVGGIKVLTQEMVFSINDILINFLAHGTTQPQTPGEKNLQSFAVGNSVAAFADPTMGTLLERTLGRIRENTHLSAEIRKRADWLQKTFDVRKVLWNQSKTKMDASVDLAGNLKRADQIIILYLFCPPSQEGQSDRDRLFNDDVAEAAQKYNDILKVIDPQYSVDQNFYVFMAGALRKLKKQIEIDPNTSKDYNRRLANIIKLYDEEGITETKRLLPSEDNIKAFKISLILKYGTTPERRTALKLLTDPITVKAKGKDPVYLVPMATIDRGLREWVEKQTTPEKKKAATEAILYAIDQTMERGEDMEVYWNGYYRDVDSFFGSDNFGKGLLGGNNNRVLQELILWARSEADEQNIELVPGQNPHVALRKWTLLGELGVAGIGVGTYLIPYSDPNTGYYGKGASIILAGSGAGAAAGNFLSYELNAGKNAWIYDVGGAVIGGLAAGLIYGFTTTKPDMGPGGPGTNPGRDPGDRTGKTPFGP